MYTTLRAHLGLSSDSRTWRKLRVDIDEFVFDHMDTSGGAASANMQGDAFEKVLNLIVEDPIIGQRFFPPESKIGDLKVLRQHITSRLNALKYESRKLEGNQAKDEDTMMRPEPTPIKVEAGEDLKPANTVKQESGIRVYHQAHRYDVKMGS
ncbi:hypothetical protein BDN72DRAFT_848016 [Pluteus cervinus]|uniref:Uncharacterized protein n=1 Tax=Pluteus cervinus TaxID=181527 RepID=A0ACD3ACG9_9AGAR|nr:hypothetical protein BDN72DRAFT_848016 [Pluteus cervinus]